MKETAMKLLKKVNDICEEGTIWKVFFVLYAILMFVNTLLALSDKKPKLWRSAMIGAGMGIAAYNMEKTKRLRAEREKNA